MTDRSSDWLKIADTYPEDHLEREKILKQIEEYKNGRHSSKTGSDLH
jgi:hypothetical protein